MYPADLKAAVAEALNVYLEPIRQKFADPALVALTKAAYPDKMPAMPSVAQVPGLDDDDSKPATPEPAASGKEKKVKAPKSKQPAPPATDATPAPAPAPTA